jgi:hypothetical protein
MSSGKVEASDRAAPIAAQDRDGALIRAAVTRPVASTVDVAKPRPSRAQ